MKGKWRSTIAERIHVGFTTTDPKGFLLGLESHISKEYLTLMVSNSGHIRDVAFINTHQIRKKRETLNIIKTLLRNINIIICYFYMPRI